MKLIMLDKIGTLLDALGPFYRSAVAVFDHYGIEAPTMDDYRENITPDFMQFYWDRGIPLYATTRDINRIIAEYRARKEEKSLLNPQPGAKELLLHCAKLGFNVVFTNIDVSKLAVYRDQELGERTLVADPISVNDNPWRDELLEILAFMDGISPSDEPWEIWCIGDTAREIAAAKSIPFEGIRTIAFTGGFDSPKKFEGLPKNRTPDHIVNSLLDIPSILDVYAHLQNPARLSPWTIN